VRVAISAGCQFRDFGLVLSAALASVAVHVAGELAQARAAASRDYGRAPNF